jgi:solute carrier family 35 protein E1
LNEFPFPLALGEFQFLIVFILSLSTILVLSNSRRLHSLFPEGTVPPLNEASLLRPNKHILMTVLPLGCFQFLGKLFSHCATALVPVSTVAGIKTLSPLILVSAYRILYNVKFPRSTYLSLIPLVAGILLIAVEDSHGTLISTTASHDHFMGVLYASLSLIVFCAQNIYGKTVFTYNQKHINNHAELAVSSEITDDNIIPLSEDKRELDKDLELQKASQNYGSQIEKTQLTMLPKIRNKYDKLTLLLYCSAIGGLLSLPWFFFIEAPHFFPIANHNSSLEDITEARVVFIPWTLLLINGVSHFFQSMIAFHLLGSIPTISYSIASMMKKMTVIVVSMIWIGHDISPTQVVGLISTAVGLYSYDRWGGKRAAS